MVHDQQWHAQHNAQHYPGNRQLCSNCDQPTERCEEDSIFLEDGTGPLCPGCYHNTEEYARAQRLEYLKDRLALKEWQKYPGKTMSKEELYAHMEKMKPHMEERYRRIEENAIDLSLPWKTYSGLKVENLSCYLGAHAISRIAGSVVLRENPKKTEYVLWFVDGVAQRDIARHCIHPYDLVL
jgi:hypothetical protein